MSRPAAEQEGRGGGAPRSTRELLPHRLARTARRATMLIGVAAVVGFLVKFETRWVPAGIDTVADIPGGSWVLLDRWRSGLRVGSKVFVTTPHGDLVSVVESVEQRAVTIRHPNPRASFGDSRMFGAISMEDVIGTVVVALPPLGQDPVR